MKKVVINCLIAFVAIFVVVFYLTSCTKMCKAFPEDRIEWLPTNYINKECVYVSGAERIVCKGDDILFSEKRLNEPCWPTAMISINNAEMSYPPAIWVCFGIHKKTKYTPSYESLSVSIAYKKSSNHFYVKNMHDYLENKDLFYPEIVLQNNTYTNVLKLSDENKNNTPWIDTVYYAQHYGVVQFIDTAGQIWHLER